MYQKAAANSTGLSEKANGPFHGNWGMSEPGRGSGLEPWNGELALDVLLLFFFPERKLQNT
jgi:hypothetical protein